MHEDKNFNIFYECPSQNSSSFQTNEQVNTHTLNLVSEFKTPCSSSPSLLKDYHDFTKIKEDPSEINILKNSNVKLNYDPTPLIIRKKPNRPISYIQNVSVKFLKPFTPPPAG